jgi:hypothetical protein
MNDWLNWLEEAWHGLVDFLYSIMLSLLDGLKDLFFWLFDTLMDLILLLMSGLGELMTAIDVVQYMTALPSETQYILSAIGVGQAMGIIASAITIRMTMNLIPFVRI